MKQNYFVYNGKQYYSGVTIIVKQFDMISGHTTDTKATFLYYDTERNRFAFVINGRTNIYPEKDFNRILVRVIEKDSNTQHINNTVNYVSYTQKNKHTLSDELNIEGMLTAWIWYIFIMAVAVIFNARIGIWILASIVFFRYRNKKLRQNGYNK